MLGQIIENARPLIFLSVMAVIAVLSKVIAKKRDR